MVDLYELAAVRNARVRDVCEQAGWVIEPPGLLLSETTEDAITILYEGLQRAAGLLEAAARTHGSRLPAGTELLENEFAHTRSDDDRLTDAYHRAWGPAQPRGRTRLADADAVSRQPGRADTADASSWPGPPLVANRDNTPRHPSPTPSRIPQHGGWVLERLTTGQAGGFE